MPQPHDIPSSTVGSFAAFQERVFASGTSLDGATKYLIAMAIASLTRNDTVQSGYAAKARQQGATEGQIAEALAVVAAQAGGTQMFWMKEDYEELLGRQWRSNLIPEVDRSFWAYKRALFADGALDERTKELIAIAASSKLRCRHCAIAHIQAAFKSGASRADVAETLAVLWAVASEVEPADGHWHPNCPPG